LYKLCKGDKKEERIDVEDSEGRAFIELRLLQIRSFVLRGPVQDLFNFYYNQDFQHMIQRIADAVMNKHTGRFKLKYDFGFVLFNIETGARKVALRYLSNLRYS